MIKRTLIANMFLFSILFIFLFNFVCGTILPYTTFLNFNTNTKSNILITNDGSITIDKNQSTLSSSYYSSAYYISKIFDAGQDSNWQTIFWNESNHYGEALPNNKLVQPDANMIGNVVLLHFDESSSSNGSTLTDNSGSSNNASLSTDNTTTNKEVSGIFSNALYFDGTADKLTITNNASFNVNPITISLWVTNELNSGSQSMLIGKTTNTYFGDGYGLFRETNNNLYFWIGAYSTSNRTGFSFTANSSFTHVVAVSDGTKMYIYKNGLLQSQANIVGTPTIPATNLGIGYYGNSYYWKGAVDDLAIFNRALSATEIMNIYLRGVQKIRLQIKSCSDSNCFSNTNFLGSDGTINTYYEDGNTTYNLFGLSNARYFQYKATFLTSDTNALAVGYPNLLDLNIKSNTTSFLDTSQSDFNNGTYYNTESTSDGNLILSKTTSYFTSSDYNKIIDFGYDANFNNFLFKKTFKFNENLPNSNSYDSDINMSDSNLLLHFDTNFNIIIADVMNSRNLYSPIGANTIATGKLSRALDLNGSTYVTSDFFQGLSSPYSISLWIKTSTKGKCIFGWNARTPGTNFEYDRELYLDASGYLGYMTAAGTTTVNTNYADGNWHHIVLIKTTSDQNLYVDGVYKNKLSGTLSDYTGFTTPRLNIGQCGRGYFNGQIDEFAIFNKTLSISEISNLYNSGNGVEVTSSTSGLLNGWHFNETALTTFNYNDSSNTAMTFTPYTGYAFSSVDSRLNGAISFAPNSILQSNTYVPPSTNLTISTWIKTNAVGGIASWSRYTPSATTYDRELYLDSSGRAAFMISGGIVTGTRNLRDNLWHNLVAVVDSSATKTYIYVDGVLEGTLASSTMINNYLTPRLNLGYVASGSGYFNGQIDEFAIFSSAYSATQVQNLYRRGLFRSKMQLRSCLDATCSTNPQLIGPDGTSNTFFINSDTNYILSSILSANRYLQYRIQLDTDNTNLTTNYFPQITDINFDYTSLMPTNSAPVITDINICDGTCAKFKSISPATEFTILANVTDVQGADDINWDSSIIQIYKSTDNNTSSNSWDHITLINPTRVTKNGCVSTANIVCYKINANDWTMKFLKGPAKIFLNISDKSFASTYSELNYVDQNSGLDVLGTTGVSIDTTNGLFDVSGPDTLNNVFVSGNGAIDYMTITHNGNQDVNIILDASDLLSNENIIPLSNLHYKLGNVQQNSPGTHLVGEDIILSNWSRGNYPDVNNIRLYLWLDVPKVMPGTYSGNMSIFGITN